jgi:3D (Asp-Asp-Asp) domain-containing protein
MKRFILLLLTASACLLSARAATINVGAVANNTNTGYYFSADGSLTTTGQILVGYFSKTELQLQALIASWAGSTVYTNNDGTVTHYSTPTFSNYTNLVSSFTRIGTGGINGSTVAGWSFSTNGTVAGTSSGVDTTVLPAGSQLYVLSLNTLDLSSSGFTTNTQWGLYTGGTNWLAPSSGTRSLVLNQVTPSGVLIGTDLAALGSSSPNYNSVEMVVSTVPEPSVGGLMVIGISFAVIMRLRRRANTAS